MMGTIPAGMLVDVYQASGRQYLFRVRYGTWGRMAITVTNAVEDARNGWGTCSGADLDPIQRKRDMTEAIQEAVDQMVEPSMSDYETAKALHDYIVLNSAYGCPPSRPQVVDGAI